MLQNITPHKLFNQYSLKTVCTPNDTVLCFSGGKLLIKSATDTLIFPKAAETGDNLNFTYLFSVDGEKYFLLNEPEISVSGFEFAELREIREKYSHNKPELYAAFTGKHLADWYRDTKFCGRCGGKMIHSERERAMICSSCGYTAYPRIMPAVIVGVINGNSILITRYRVGYRHNALVAGFTEIGETMEETVAREVMEETGLNVRNIRYYKSQPWGIANDMLIGFFCEVDGETSIRMDENELKYAEWVKREDIELQPDDLSLTNDMMRYFKEQSI